MTRSNGSGFPPNGWPAGYPQPDPAQPYQNQYPAQPQYPQNVPPQQPVTTGRPARIQNTQGRAPQQPAPVYTPPPQGYAPPQSQPYGQQPQDPYAQPQSYPPQAPFGLPQASQQAPQYAQPPRQTTQTYGAPSHPVTQPPASYASPAAYAPAHYDPSAVPPTRPTAPPQRPASSYASPYQAPPASTPQSTYVPPQQAPSAYNSWQGGSTPSVDPQGYDLGAYMPAPVHPSADPRTGRPTAPPAWQQAQAPAYAPQPAPVAYAPADQGYGSFGSPIEAGFEPDVAHHQAHEHEEGYDEGYDEDYAEAEGSRPRYGLILASIVAAFAIGGGLTYAYKIFFAPHAQIAGAPVVKNGSDPFKVKPADAGGTKFSNTDAKVMDQLGGSDGPRVVQTMKVERDGTITSGATSANPTPASSPPVPGMILDGGPQRSAIPPANAAGAVLQAADQQKPATRIAAAPLPAAAAPPAAAPAAAAPSDDVPAAVPTAPKRNAKKVALPATVAPAAVAAAPKAATGSNGYVAVLASVPASGSSRMQAMQQFADLQQKYGDVLGSKAPDVVEAKLDKGTYHRLVVGPPASRDSAKQVCEKLKAAGYTSDCWVTAF